MIVEIIIGKKILEIEEDKMKQIKITVLLMVTCIILCACPKIEDECRYLTFVNKSVKRIGFQPHFLTENLTFEDTLFQCSKSVFGVYPNTLRRLNAGTHTDWKKEMNGYSYLQILIIDETYDQYIAEPCDTIREYVPILHRYRLTLEDLQRMNWTVVYPPEE